MSHFTPQQHDALEKAYATLSEQFEGVLIAVMASSHDGKESIEATRVYHYGGRVVALGLCEEAKNRLMNIPPKETEQ